MKTVLYFPNHDSFICTQFPVFWILLMSSKICNETSNKGLSHYFSRKTVDFSQRKNLKVKKKMLLNDYIIKNNADITILITWLMLKFLLKSKDMLYQVLSDLGEVSSFWCGPKSSPCLSKVQKYLPGIGLIEKIQEI